MADIGERSKQRPTRFIDPHVAPDRPAWCRAHFAGSRIPSSQWDPVTAVCTNATEPTRSAARVRRPAANHHLVGRPPGTDVIATIANQAGQHHTQRLELARQDIDPGRDRSHRRTSTRGRGRLVVPHGECGVGVDPNLWHT